MQDTAKKWPGQKWNQGEMKIAALAKGKIETKIMNLQKLDSIATAELLSASNLSVYLTVWVKKTKDIQMGQYNEVYKIWNEYNVIIELLFIFFKNEGK